MCIFAGNLILVKHHSVVCFYVQAAPLKQWALMFSMLIAMRVIKTMSYQNYIKESFCVICLIFLYEMKYNLFQSKIKRMF